MSIHALSGYFAHWQCIMQGFSFCSEGTTRVPSPTGGKCCVVFCVWAPAPFSCFLVGLLVFVCVNRYALLARGNAFRLHAAGFLRALLCSDFRTEPSS